MAEGRRRFGPVVWAGSLVVGMVVGILVVGMVVVGLPVVGGPGGSSVAAAAGVGRSSIKTHTVPAGIAHTGSTDVTKALATFIAGVPNNSTITFQAGGVYRLDGTLELTDRTGLTILGNGATLITTPTTVGTRAQLRLVGGGSYHIRNLTIRGSSQVGGTAGAYVSTLQWQHGIDVRGVAGLDVYAVTVTDVYGDCFYLGRGYGASNGRGTTGVRIHGSTCMRNGRQGVAMVDGQDMAVDHSKFSAIALMTFDVEPNPGDAVRNVSVVDNAIGTGPRQQALGVVGHGPVNGVTMTGNTLTGKPLTVILDSASDLRLANITVSNNTSDTGLWITNGASIVAVDVDGLTATGNHQRLDGPGMSFAHISGSCTVSVWNNTYPGGISQAVIDPYPCP
jgi:hypothetical protein